MTPAEKKLWYFLRGRKLLRLKFRRQFPIGPFIADFYCPEYKLIVEIDGAVHQLKVKHDSTRSCKLIDQGYQLLRFSNEQVLESSEWVLEQIRLVLPLSLAEGEG